jgi:hypothetical protein
MLRRGETTTVTTSTCATLSQSRARGTTSRLSLVEPSRSTPSLRSAELARRPAPGVGEVGAVRARSARGHVPGALRRRSSLHLGVRRCTSLFGRLHSHQRRGSEWRYQVLCGAGSSTPQVDVETNECRFLLVRDGVTGDNVGDIAEENELRRRWNRTPSTL